MHPYDRFIKIYGRLPTERDPRYLELVRMSKYAIRDTPSTQPGKCTNCGCSRYDGRKYVDIGVHVEFYGDLEFCSLCIADMARTLGLFRANEVRILQLEELVEKFRQREDLGDEIKNTVLHTFDRVKEYFNGNSSNLTGNDMFSVTDSNHTASDKESNVETPGNATRSSSSTKSGTVKSATGTRSKDVPSITELINANKQ